MSAVMADPPTWTEAVLNGLPVVIEDRPELAHRGIRFRAHFASSPNGIDGLGSTESGAVEALEEADREETERRAELVEEGEAPWYLGGGE